MYQALYRKWRPKTFDEVSGQAHVTQTLKNQVAHSRLSHAYLFIGTRGTGKTSCAKILAKAVNCLSPKDGNPCNRCSACQGIDSGAVMDVVEMDAASNNGVDNVRALREEAVFSPSAVKKRVYIVDEVHMLSNSAFNALLKILEEPPEHLMFILATTELHKVPATILSRCQRHTFKRLDIPTIVARLRFVAEQESISLEESAAALIARLSEGGMRDALSLLDQCSGREVIDVDAVYSAMGLAGRQQTVLLMEQIAARDTAGALGTFHGLWQEGKDPATVLGELSSLARYILMLKVSPQGGEELLSADYDTETLSRFLPLFSGGVLVDSIRTIQDTLSAMRSGQAKTRCELCLAELCRPDLGDGLASVRNRVARLESALQNGGITSGGQSAQAVSSASQSKGSHASEGLRNGSQMTTEGMRTGQLANERPLNAPQAVTGQQSNDGPPNGPQPTANGRWERQIPPDNRQLDWNAVLYAARERLNPGQMRILSNCTCALNNSELYVYVPNEFMLKQVNQGAVLETLSGAASYIVGHPIRVFLRLPEKGMPETKINPEEGRNRLEDLKKFDIVTFQ